jgi:hypothetical protein
MWAVTHPTTLFAYFAPTDRQPLPKCITNTLLHSSQVYGHSTVHTVPAPQRVPICLFMLSVSHSPAYLCSGFVSYGVLPTLLGQATHMGSTPLFPHPTWCPSTSPQNLWLIARNLLLVCSVREDSRVTQHNHGATRLTPFYCCTRTGSSRWCFGKGLFGQLVKSPRNKEKPT